MTKLPIVPKVMFVAELLVDGALFHLLLCGHIQRARNDDSGAPLEFQVCRQCERQWRHIATTWPRWSVAEIEEAMAPSPGREVFADGSVGKVADALTNSINSAGNAGEE